MGNQTRREELSPSGQPTQTCRKNEKVEEIFKNHIRWVETLRIRSEDRRGHTGTCVDIGPGSGEVLGIERSDFLGYFSTKKCVFTLGSSREFLVIKGQKSPKKRRKKSSIFTG